MSQTLLNFAAGTNYSDLPKITNRAYLDYSGFDKPVLTTQFPRRGITGVSVPEMKNKFVKRIINMFDQSSQFKIIVAGGYALNMLLGREQFYRGDVDLWLEVKNTESLKDANKLATDADDFVNAFLKKIVDMSSTNYRFNNSDNPNVGLFKLVPVYPQVEEKFHKFKRYTIHDLVRSKNAITIKLNEEKAAYVSGRYVHLSTETREFQIILRIHKSTEDIISRFDVEPCQVAYNPTTKVYNTFVKSLDAALGQYITVNPAKNSPTYINRLVKYWGYGYAIVMEHLDVSKLSGSYSKDPEIYLKTVFGGKFCVIWSSIEGNVIRTEKLRISTQSGKYVKTSVSSFDTIGEDGEPSAKKSVERNYYTAGMTLVSCNSTHDNLAVLDNEMIKGYVESGPTWKLGRYPSSTGQATLAKYYFTIFTPQDMKLLNSYMYNKYINLKDNKGLPKANKYLDVIKKRLVDAQTTYITYKIIKKVNEFNESTNTAEKRWNIVSIEIDSSRTPITKEEWYGDFLKV